MKYEIPQSFTNEMRKAQERLRRLEMSTYRTPAEEDIPTLPIDGIDIMPGTIPGSYIIDGSLTADELAANSITAVHLAANSITADDILAGTITAIHIATDSLTADVIAAGAITADEILANTISADKILANSLTSDTIAANAITTDELAANAVNADKIAANSITATEIAADAITVSELAAGSVNASKIIAHSLTAGEIEANTLTASEIAADAITATELAANSVIASKIAAGAITATKITAGSITGDRITAGTITGVEIAGSTITGANVVASTLGSSHISVANLEALSTNMGNLTAGVITGATVQTGTSPSARMIMNSSGLKGINGSGATVFDFKTSDGSLTLAGTITAEAGSIIPAGVLTGQLTDSQIASIDAAKIAGQLTADQLSVNLGGGNLVPDSSFEGGSANWILFRSGGTGGTIAPETASARYGAKRLKITAGTTNTQIGVTRNTGATSLIRISSSKNYTLSAWVMSAATSRNSFVKVQWYQANGTTFISEDVGTDVATVVGDWVRIDNLTAVTSPSNAAYANVVVAFKSPATGEIHYVDGIQLEDGDIVTAYAPTPGEIQPGSIGTLELADNAIVAAKIADNAIAQAKLQDAIINTAKLVDGAVSDAKISAMAASKVTGQLTNSQLADLAATKITGTLTSSQIADLAATKLTGQITSTQITDNAITSPKIQAGAVIAGKVAADAITATEIAANAITSAEINAGAVITAKLAANAVTANEIAANAVTSVKINAGAVIAGKVAADAIAANEIAADAITASEIAANAVTASEISANAVTAGKINANAVTANEIAADSVGASEIVADSITASEIAANAITASEIAANAVTAAKIIANAVTADKIQAEAVSAEKILANTITSDQIMAASIIAESIAAEAITAEKIAAGTITSTEIAAGAITAAKLSLTLGGNNMLLNASAESSLGVPEYVNSSIAAVVKSSETMPYHGAYVFKHTNTSTSNNQSRWRTSVPVFVVPNKPFTLSAKVKSPVASRRGRVFLTWYTSADVAISSPSGAFINLSTDWQDVPKLTAIAPSNAVKAHVFFETATLTGNFTAVGEVYYWDAIQFQPGDTATEFAPMAGEVLPGSIGNTQLSPDAVTSDKILAGTITTNEINVAAGITGTQIAGTTITGDNIVGRTITGAKLAANTITTSEVSIIPGGNNLLFNSSAFDGTNGWTPSAVTIASDSSVKFGHWNSIKNTVTSIASAPLFYSAWSTTNIVPVAPGLDYTASVYVRPASGSRQFRVSLYYYDSGGTVLVSPDSAYITAPAGVWTRMEISYLAPAGANRARIVVWNNNLAGGTTVGDIWYAAGMQIETGQWASAYGPRPDEILPNSVGTTQIQSGAITSGEITATEWITAKMFKTSSVTTGKRLEFDAAGLRAYDASNAQVLNYDVATGALSLKGSISIGSTVPAASLTTGSIPSGVTLPAAQVATGTIQAGVNVPGGNVQTGVSASNVTTGTLSGGLVGTGLNAGNVTTGTLPEPRIPSGVTGSKISGSLSNATLAGGSITGIGSISGVMLTDDTITGPKIVANTITADRLILGYGGRNYLRNSSAEDITGTSGLVPGWGSPSGATIGRSTAQSRTGSASILMTSTTSGANAHFSNASDRTPIEPGQRMTASAYIRPNVGSVPMRIRVIFYDATGTSLTALESEYGNIVTGASGQWTRIYKNGITAPPNTATVRTLIYMFPVAAIGNSVYVDDIQVELGSEATSYMPKPEEILPGTILAEMIQADAINGKTITGATIRTDILGSDRLELTSTGLQKINSDGTVPIQITPGGGIELLAGLDYDRRINWVSDADETTFLIQNYLQATNNTYTYLDTIAPVGGVQSNSTLASKPSSGADVAYVATHWDANEPRVDIRAYKNSKPAGFTAYSNATDAIARVTAGTLDVKLLDDKGVSEFLHMPGQGFFSASSSLTLTTSMQNVPGLTKTVDATAHYIVLAVLDAQIFVGGTGEIIGQLLINGTAQPGQIICNASRATVSQIWYIGPTDGDVIKIQAKKGIAAGTASINSPHSSMLVIGPIL